MYGKVIRKSLRLQLELAAVGDVLRWFVIVPLGSWKRLQGYGNGWGCCYILNSGTHFSLLVSFQHFLLLNGDGCTG